MSEAISEPFTSVNCPFCGALIPFFKKKDMVKCEPCGAELKIGFVQPVKSPEPPRFLSLKLPGSPPRVGSVKNPIIVILLKGFAQWLNSKEDEKNES